MKQYSYKGQVITASTKEEAIAKIVTAARAKLIKTKLQGKGCKRILEIVLENMPKSKTEGVKVLLQGKDVVLSIPADNAYMADKPLFHLAKNLKRIAKESGEWSRYSWEDLPKQSSKDEFIVGEAYYVYDVLMGRDITKFEEYVELSEEAGNNVIPNLEKKREGEWVAKFNEWNHDNKLYKQFCKDFENYFKGDATVEIGMGGGFGGGYYDHSVYFKVAGKFEKALKKKKLFDDFVDDAREIDGVVNVTNEFKNQMNFIIYVNDRRSVIKVDGNKSWWKQLKANPKFVKLLNFIKDKIKEYKAKMK